MFVNIWSQKLLSHTQVAPVVNSRGKKAREKGPHGMITTYGDYQKTTFINSDGQGQGRKGHFCGLYMGYRVKTSPNRKNKATFTIKTFLGSLMKVPLFFPFSQI